MPPPRLPPEPHPEESTTLLGHRQYRLRLHRPVSRRENRPWRVSHPRDWAHHGPYPPEVVARTAPAAVLPSPRSLFHVKQRDPLRRSTSNPHRVGCPRAPCQSRPSPQAVFVISLVPRSEPSPHERRAASLRPTGTRIHVSAPSGLPRPASNRRTSLRSPHKTQSWSRTHLCSAA